MFRRRPEYGNLPPELREISQWLLWRFERKSNGSITKVPYQCTGYRASTTDPRHWSRHDYAIKIYDTQRVRCDGIGFVFSPEDPLCGIDIDDCFLSDAAEIAPWAAPIEQRFANTYREASPSEMGIKIFCVATASRCGKWPVGGGKVEIYDREHFFTVTGWADETVPHVITDHQRDVELLVANLNRLKSREHAGTPASPYGCIPALIPQGERHNTLIRIAGWLWHRGLDAEEIAAALHTFNRRRCDPPHTPEHIDQIIQSMERSWAR